jgi:hypothetical protein
MRETIPSFGIKPPFLGAKTHLGSPQNYLGKSSQFLLTINNHLNQSKLKSQPLLDSQLSSALVQRSPNWDTEFDNSELPLSEYLQVNESDNRVEQTKAEFPELSPTKVYVVEELPLDFTASVAPIQTSTKRKNTRKTTKAKSNTKSSTRKTKSKKTVPDVIKQAHSSIDSNPQSKKKRRSKIDFLLEQQGLGENGITPAAETISSMSEQSLHSYSSEDLPFQPTALEQSITPVEKKIQFVAPAEPVNTDSSPATITTPIQLAPIPESHQESTLDTVYTTEEIVSSSTQKQSDRQLATAEQIIEQTIASSDRSVEPIENPPSQPTAREISVKSKAAQLQQSTEQKTGITLNHDEETTATEAIPPSSPLPYSSPNMEKQRLNLPLEQRLKEVEENEKSPVAEVESNIISNQQLAESNIALGNLEVTNSSTVEPRDRYSAIPEESEAEIPPTTPKLFTIPEASQEIQLASTIPVLPATPVQPFLHAAADSQQLPLVPDAAPKQIITQGDRSIESVENPLSQTQALDTPVTPENVSSLQQPVAEPPTTPKLFTIPEASPEIQPEVATSTIPVLPATPVQPFLHAAADSQQLPLVPDAAAEQIITQADRSIESVENPSAQTRQLDTTVTPENVSSLQHPIAEPATTPKLFTIPEASPEIQPEVATSTIPVLPDTSVQPIAQTPVRSEQQLPSVPDAAPEQIITQADRSIESVENPLSQTQALDTPVTPENVSSLQHPITPPVALDVLTTATGAKQIYPAYIDEIDNEESSVVEIGSNTISKQQLTEFDIAPSVEVPTSSIVEPRDRHFPTPQESEAQIPPVVEPRRHVSAPDLQVKQSRNLQQQDRFEAESPNQSAHPTPQTEPADSIASANNQQPPIQEALLERTTGDRETPNSQAESRNESAANSLEESASQAETETVFSSQVPPQGFAVGGAVPVSTNLTSKPIAASDTVPAMLTPGEFVVNATDAQKHFNILHHINKGGSVEIFPENSTLVESSDAAIAPHSAPSSVQRKLSHTSLPRVVTLIPPTLQLAEEPAAAKNPVTQPDLPQTHYAATPLIFRKPAPTPSPPDSIPDRWDSVEDLLFGGTASDNTYTSANTNMAVPSSYSNRNALPSTTANSETIISSVQPQGFAKGGEVASDTFTPAQAIAHTIEAPASSQKKGNSNDLEMLAREVYHRLRQRLELERERHGFYSGRLPW